MAGQPGAGRATAALGIDHAVDQDDEEFAEGRRADIDTEHTLLLAAQEEGVQGFDIGLPTGVPMPGLASRVLLEHQQRQQVALGEVFPDQLA